MQENSSRTGLVVALVIVALLVVGWFVFLNNNGTEDEVEPAVDQTEQRGVAPQEETRNVVEVASASAGFEVLVAALERAGLVDTLSGEGPFTVFAPTDEAFEALLSELNVTQEELLEREDLAQILTYHVVSGQVSAQDAIALDGQSAETVNGAGLGISVRDGSVFVNESRVTTADVEASNGVIHVIDKVLLPPTI
jgi:transforming growth factor-beta-induced protein